MPVGYEQRISSVRTFQQLLRYLEAELDWPIDEMDIDDLTFDYEPEELGLDPKIAAKIRQIKQLRPLAASQPFGIFFIEFEPKTLPVTALCRILGRLAIRKRASTADATRKTWSQDDLLFVSACGDDATRRIDFAHFADDAANGLPTLRILGWDRDDTSRRTAWVERQLRDQLAWPDGESPDEWRIRWREAFVLRHREVITTSKQLARRLADLARDIRDRVNDALDVEPDTGPLTTLMNAFRQTLIHDLEPDDFADMYAQTIAYGLLSARVSRPAAIHKGSVVDMVPVTNPFLKELLETFLTVGGREYGSETGGMAGIDFDELGVNDVVDLLNHDDTNMEAVLRDFNHRNPQEDPVVHFYELFLKEYDAKKRMQRGVFYTPKPVVAYIVRSVHELLQSEFGLEDGLADTTTWGEMIKKHTDFELPEIEVVDPETRKVSKQTIDPATPFVQILDPATGTATFLVEVIDVIHETMRAKWQAQGQGELWINRKWNEYVPQHLVPRLHGYELMMAPYVIAHMKIGLALDATGFNAWDKLDPVRGRARIYLTNALEPPQDFADTFQQMAPALAHEAQAVNHVKRRQRFTVLLGNPPYSTISQNRSDWIRGLIDDYFMIDTGRMEERGNRNQLQDDYVKFYRFMQHHLPSCGIVGLISNSSYLRGPWFRGMRYQLLRHFDRVDILDLHGAQAHSLDPHEVDQNVFEITTAVAIALLVRSLHARASPVVTYAGVVGTRRLKYDRLNRRFQHRLTREHIAPSSENQWRLVPHDGADRDEWSAWPPLPAFFNAWGAGVLTNRNGLAVDIDRDRLLQKIRRFADLSIPDTALEADYGFSSNYQWSTGRARKAFASSPVADLREQYTFRPFDLQWIYWHRNVVYNMRGDKMEVFRQDQPPLGLMFSRNTKHRHYSNIFITRHIADRHCLEEANVAPVYAAASEDLLTGQSAPNFTQLAETVVQLVGLRLTSARRENLIETCGCDDLVSYLYAVLYSPIYRERYAHLLRIDFPRAPITANLALFLELVRLGGELAAIHLLESRLDNAITTYIGPANPTVEKVGYTTRDTTVWLDRKQTRGFVGVPQEVWNFHIGGYRVCEKWLRDRRKKGGNNPRPARTLTRDDLAHYHKIVLALNHTIRLMKEIDAAIQQHGGWPDAFITDPGELEKRKGR